MLRKFYLFSFFIFLFSILEAASGQDNPPNDMQPLFAAPGEGEFGGHLVAQPPAELSGEAQSKSQGGSASNAKKKEKRKERKEREEQNKRKICKIVSQLKEQKRIQNKVFSSAAAPVRGEQGRKKRGHRHPAQLSTEEATLQSLTRSISSDAEAGRGGFGREISFSEYESLFDEDLSGYNSDYKDNYHASNSGFEDEEEIRAKRHRAQRLDAMVQEALERRGVASSDSREDPDAWFSDEEGKLYNRDKELEASAIDAIHAFCISEENPWADYQSEEDSKNEAEERIRFYELDADDEEGDSEEYSDSEEEDDKYSDSEEGDGDAQETAASASAVALDSLHNLYQQQNGEKRREANYQKKLQQRELRKQNKEHKAQERAEKKASSTATPPMSARESVPPPVAEAPSPGQTPLYERRNLSLGAYSRRAPQGRVGAHLQRENGEAESSSAARQRGPRVSLPPLSPELRVDRGRWGSLPLNGGAMHGPNFYSGGHFNGRF